MGLDDFKSEDDNDSDTNSSSSASSTNSGSTGDDSNGGTVNSDDDNSNVSTTGGLDSFRTNATRGGSADNTDKDDTDNTVFGIPPYKWRRMSIKERVAEVRQSKIPDFKPDLQLDERWKWEKAARIYCVCGNQFYLSDRDECLNCGREYSVENRTVVKTSDPENKIIHNDE